MQSLSKPAIARALANVTQSERAALTVPAGFADVDWAVLDFYGWRDPKYPKRGYLVRQRETSMVAVAVNTSGGGLTPGRKAMCAICRAVDNSSSIALFAARRTGAPGRAGSTVGTYICADLDCSAQLRDPGNRLGRSRLTTVHDDIDAVAADMLARLDAFLDAVGVIGPE